MAVVGVPIPSWGHETAPASGALMNERVDEGTQPGMIECELRLLGQGGRHRESPGQLTLASVVGGMGGVTRRAR